MNSATFTEHSGICRVKQLLLTVKKSTHAVEQSMLSVEQSMLSVEQSMLSVDKSMLSVDKSMLSVDKSLILAENNRRRVSSDGTRQRRTVLKTELQRVVGILSFTRRARLHGYFLQPGAGQKFAFPPCVNILSKYLDK